jgi:nitroreductase
MKTDPDRDINMALDAVLERRRSIRRFKDEVPPREYVEQVIKAGVFAPYAGMVGKPLAEMRRFTVLTKNTGAMSSVQALMMAQMKKNAKKLKLLSRVVPFLRNNAGPFVKVLENASVDGLPAFKTAPYLIVVGERKGFPPVEKQSLAYVLENMWLKAAALGLGFQVVSAFQSMGENKEFLELAGIPYGEFEVDGCALGFPDQEPSERSMVEPAQITKWL